MVFYNDQPWYRLDLTLLVDSWSMDLRWGFLSIKYYYFGIDKIIRPYTFEHSSYIVWMILTNATSDTY